MKEKQAYHFARWQELPDIDLYMDQLVSYIEKQLDNLVIKDEKAITASMINNYVKLGLIPKPIKKRYNRQHLAYLTAITVLKQVIPIAVVKKGIDQVVAIHGDKQAYNLFCEVTETVLESVLNQTSNHATSIILEDITTDNLSLYLASLAFASKIAAIKVIEA